MKSIIDSFLLKELSVPEKLEWLKHRHLSLLVDPSVTGAMTTDTILRDWLASKPSLFTSDDVQRKLHYLSDVANDEYGQYTSLCANLTSDVFNILEELSDQLSCNDSLGGLLKVVWCSPGFGNNIPAMDFFHDVDFPGPDDPDYVVFLSCLKYSDSFRDYLQGISEFAWSDDGDALSYFVTELMSSSTQYGVPVLCGYIEWLYLAVRSLETTIGTLRALELAPESASQYQLDTLQVFGITAGAKICLSNVAERSRLLLEKARGRL